MDNLDMREWLLTNGLGSFACGTVCDARTRTYHGWLIAALQPPSDRTLLLSHLDASLEVAGKVWALSTNFWSGGSVEPKGYQLLRNFSIEPVPTWIWSEDNWQLRRQLVMPYGIESNERQGGQLSVNSHQSSVISYQSSVNSQQSPVNSQQSTVNSQQSPVISQQFSNRILIQYRYRGTETATLRLRLLIGDRDFHHQQSAELGWQFQQLIGNQQICIQAIRPGSTGTPWHLRWSNGDYRLEGVWYWNYFYPEEKLRGLGSCEDLYSPGYLTVILKPGDTITLEAKVGLPESAQPVLQSWEFEQAVEAEEQRLNQLANQLWENRGSKVAGKDKGDKVDSYQSTVTSQQSTVNSHQSTVTNPKLLRQLLKASDQFIAYRSAIAGLTIIAGYPWFNDWGRDTLIALPGLALSTGRFDIAKGLLETFGRYCRDGLIPNTFPDTGIEPIYNSIDASLWWVETLGLYLEATQDWDFLVQQYPVVQQIYKAFMAGTHFGITVDAADSLLTWNAKGVAITWMDVVIDGEPITPRTGKPVEINALWYSALCWLSIWAEQLSKLAVTDSARLNNQTQLYAQQAERVKASLQKFWNPSHRYFYDRIAPDDFPDPKIRPNAVLALSLTHCGFPVHQARAVLEVARDRLLTPYGLRSLAANDPDYIGSYAGDRWHRDRAYHQGTIWSWLIGPFVRAWEKLYDHEPVPFSWEPLLEHFQQQACIGSVSEIFDGDAPHSPQGAFAQAWSVAELLRHYPD